MKINLLEICEDIYKGKKKSHPPVVSLMWSFSGLSSRLENPTLFNGVVLVYYSWFSAK